MVLCMKRDYVGLVMTGPRTVSILVSRQEVLQCELHSLKKCSLAMCEHYQARAQGVFSSDLSVSLK